MEKRQLPEDFKDFIKFLNSNNIDNININIISIKDLITNKRGAGRDQDITDANKLEKFLNINKNEYINITQKSD